MMDNINLKKRISRREFVQGLGLSTVAAVVLAACTKENDHYVVKIDSQNFYDPSTLIIPVGTTVTWQNISLLPHTVTCDPTKAQNSAHVLLPKNAPTWDSGQLYPGQMWSYTFDTPGNYIYFSRPHESDTMLGALTVTSL
jgi:plastocyanin